MPTLTDRTVIQAKAGAVRAELPDSLVVGLRLVVQPSGRKSWAVRYRVGRRTRKLTLGSYPIIPLATARDKARAALQTVAAGTDPAASKRAGVPGDASIAAAVVLYKERHVTTLRPRTVHYVGRELDAMAEEWRGRALASITKRDIIAILDKATDRGDAAGNTTWKVIKAFLAWCAGRDMIETSPAAGIKRPAKEVPRDRVLDDAELAAVWRAADKAGGAAGASIKLLILTGCRRNEIAYLERSEVQADKIVLPRERTKTNEAHAIHLTPLMRAVLDTLPATGRYVLNGSNRPLSGGAHVKEKITALMRASAHEDIPAWTVHDLRRSFATGMGRLKIAPHVIERCLNHKLGGIAGIYQHHDFADEMKDAWERWGNHISTIVA